MKNSTSVTVTKRRIRLSVTTIRRSDVAGDRPEPDVDHPGPVEAYFVTRDLPSSVHSAEPVLATEKGKFG